MEHFVVDMPVLFRYMGVYYPGTIVETDTDEHDKLYRVRHDEPIRFRDNSGNQVYIVSSWHYASMIMPDYSRIRDERIKQIIT